MNIFEVTKYQEKRETKYLLNWRHTPLDDAETMEAKQTQNKNKKFSYSLQLINDWISLKRIELISRSTRDERMMSVLSKLDWYRFKSIECMLLCVVISRPIHSSVNLIVFSTFSFGTPIHQQAHNHILHLYQALQCFISYYCSPFWEYL